MNFIFLSLFSLSLSALGAPGVPLQLSVDCKIQAAKTPPKVGECYDQKCLWKVHSIGVFALTIELSKDSSQKVKIFFNERYGIEIFDPNQFGSLTPSLSVLCSEIGESSLKKIGLALPKLKLAMGTYLFVTSNPKHEKLLAYKEIKSPCSKLFEMNLEKNWKFFTLEQTKDKGCLKK
jgi:hypothetical protein